MAKTKSTKKAGATADGAQKTIRLTNLERRPVYVRVDRKRTIRLGPGETSEALAHSSANAPGVCCMVDRRTLAVVDSNDPKLSRPTKKARDEVGDNAPGAKAYREPKTSGKADASSETPSGDASTPGAESGRDDSPSAANRTEQKNT